MEKQTTLSVGPYANELAIDTGTECMAIGFRAEAFLGVGSIAFGDNTQAADGETVIGKDLFGKPMPDGVRQMVASHGKDLKWVLDQIFSLR